MIGFLNIHKPAGPTSHDIVAAVRRRLPRCVKVGHCGTLDPFAEGVLVICVGPATRLAEYVQRQPKRYLAEITLGATSTTDDPTGEIAPYSTAGRAMTGCDAPADGVPGAGDRRSPAPPTDEQLRAAISRFVGEVRQRPPSHSAIHVNGTRAYKLARRGEEVEIPERTVRVDSIDLVRYEWPRAEIDVRCGGGTYIRALARDIGAALGAGGYCSKLARTEVGVFRLADSRSPEAVDVARDLLPPRAALGNMPTLRMTSEECAKVRMGQRVALRDAANAIGAECALLDESGGLVAIAEQDADARVLLPRIVLGAV